MFEFPPVARELVGSECVDRVLGRLDGNGFGGHRRLVLGIPASWGLDRTPRARVVAWCAVSRYPRWQAGTTVRRALVAICKGQPRCANAGADPQISAKGAARCLPHVTWTLVSLPRISSGPKSAGPGKPPA